MGRSRKPGRGFAFNEQQFNMLSEKDWGEEYLQYTINMAENAWRLRNAFKFKMNWREQAAGAADEIAMRVLSTPMSPPFEHCVFVLNEWAPNCDLVLLVDCDRKSDEGLVTYRHAYESAGIMPGDSFVSILPCVYRADGMWMNALGRRDVSQPLSFWPLEIHLKLHATLEDRNFGIAAYPPFCNLNPMYWGNESGDRNLQRNLVTAVYFLLWTLSAHEVRTIPGLAPRKRGMPKPKGRRVFYEHHVIDVDPFAVKRVSGAASGIVRGSPRFHAVRGFWRHYKNPIKSGPHAGETQVWIEPQWRGDKNKGVITKDYNILSMEEDDDDPRQR